METGMSKTAAELKAGDRIQFNGKWRKISHVAKSSSRVTVYFPNSEMDVLAIDMSVEAR
jgi:ribosomal 50S subunit-recycling heat shock protein